MTYKNLTVALLSLFLISCGGDSAGPKALSTKAEKRGKPTLGVNATSSPNLIKPQGSSWGRVYIDETRHSSQLEFNNQVILLLEPQFTKEEVGVVNGIDDRDKPVNEQSATGIAFWGKGLTLSGGLDASRTDYPEQDGLFDTNTAALRLSIFMAVKNDTDPTVSDDVVEVPIHFNDGESGDSGKLVDSYIHGNYIQLTFADEFGKVSLAGTFDQNLFKGQVIFKTEKIDQDNDGVLEKVEKEVEVLGKFEVSTCGFFNCTN